MKASGSTPTQTIERLCLLQLSTGNGIINADGDLWKIQRKAGLRFFSTPNLKTLIDVVLPPIVADTQRTLDAAVQNATLVDLQSVLLELTTRLMGNMAYDVRLELGVLDLLNSVYKRNNNK